MKLKGKIIQVLEQQAGVCKNGNQWACQGYVLETIEQYPRKVYFEVFGEERIKQNPCAINQVVDISFDIESREFNGRWYTTVRAWKIEPGGQSQDNNEQNETPKSNVVTVKELNEQPSETQLAGNDDGLPF